MTTSLRWYAAGVLAALVSMAATNDARACGGTFCDTGPTAMPVDQTGENILFVMKPGIVEAHVQIQYTGDPERFAWIVPMQKVPEVTVGSQPLFTALLQSTVPSYGFSTQQATCPSDDDLKRSGGDAQGFAPNPSEDSGGGVNVVYQKKVGSFEVAALEGGTAAEVVEWLDANGYQQADAAPAILERYVEKGFVFVAVKLTAGAGIDEIHPLTFTYQGDEPCVPLELTAIAAVPDMGVRAFFLGHDRVIPTTYRHVVVNPLKIDWLNLGANYRDVVIAAVDADHADGQAFVTEYAGPSTGAAPFLPDASRWDASRLAGATPDTVLNELAVQGLYTCFNQCQAVSPLLPSILADYLPVPIGITADAYYGCPSCVADGDHSKWDAEAFAMAVEDRIIEPQRHAASLLAENPYVTRLFTLISPDEMNRDPMFREQPELPEVPLPALATRQMRCDGTSTMTLPDGHVVWLEENATTWPFSDGTGSTSMNAALRVESFDLPGKSTVLADNDADVERQLKEHNGEFTDDGCGCRVPGGRSGAPSLPAMAAGLGALALLRARGATRR